MQRRALLRHATAFGLLAGSSRALLAAPAAADPAELAAPFNRLVPARVSDEIVLRQIDTRSDGVSWRELQIPPATTGASATARTERVSVRDGVRAMYALTSGQLFANVKVETSMPGQFDRDRALCIEAMRNRHQAQAATVQAWLPQQSAEVQSRFAQALEPGRVPYELSDARVRGIDTLWAGDNLFGASASPAMVHFFLPQEEAIVTAYLLNQKASVFKTAADFGRRREAFIDGYAQALADAIRARREG